MPSAAENRYANRSQIERLIKSVSKINYPKDKLHIQILDDSTDQEAVTILDSVVKELRSLDPKFDLEIIHRKIRTSYKAGALNSCCILFLESKANEKVLFSNKNRMIINVF